VRRDDGSTLPLALFFGMLCLVLVFAVVSATSLYLERKRLFTLADGAALVGAESFDLDDVTETPSGYRPTLTSPTVEAAVRGYLDAMPDTFDSLALQSAGTDDGRSATVTLSCYWSAPIVSLLVPDGLRIEVTSVARSVFG